MIRTKRNEQAKVISGINITPFTDVCLVLLIIFLVVAPGLLQSQQFGAHKVNLPTGDPKTTLNAVPPMIVVQPGPAFFVNETPVTLETLGAELSKCPKGADGKLVPVLNADGAIPYEVITSVIEIAGKAGATDVQLAVRRVSAETPPDSTIP